MLPTPISRALAFLIPMAFFTDLRGLVRALPSLPLNGPMKIRYCVVCLVLLAWSAPAFAQVDAAIATVKQHFVQNEARYGASAEDLAELIVTDAYTGRRTNATYVYLRQAHNGIEVYNATAQAVVTSDNEIMSPHARFVSDLADRVNTNSPVTAPEDAAHSAAIYLRSIASSWKVDGGVGTDGPGAGRIVPRYFVFVPESAELVYFALDNGDVRLAWNVALDTRDHQHYFTARVDAVNGQVLDYGDQVDHDNWETLLSGRGEQVPDYAPIETNRGVGAPEYRVFALPCESPNHCGRALDIDPADPTASSLGWHDDGSTSYTTTQGNNAHAYTDTDANNIPDPGSSPDGGGALHFDFPLDLGMDPSTYQPAAVTNLFYWNNIIHDVMYLYGFDEASGNFQEDNLGNGGAGSDYVNAEAQDGSGTNNANFFTPADGSNPRMQMFLWDGLMVLEVLFPPSIAGDYNTLIAGFGPQMSPDADMAGNVEYVDDGSAEPTRGCGALIGFTPGKIALIERGDCEFGTKVLNAENAGAIGAVVHNCTPGSPGCSTNNPGEGILTMGAGANGGSVTIPSYFVAESTGITIASELPGTVTISATPDNVDIDGDFDNGIIVHEYGHGISNRLTGGPANVGCLNNEERPSEGWSDWYGLMFTQEVGDTGADPRGIGTFVTEQPVDGVGIRPAPYSTDFGINDYTYGRTADGTLSVPHGIGFVWATIIWEATWELINAFGYDPDIYTPSGTAGNQIMFNLITEGMKLQPCSPGFVDGRDAILDADTLLYGGDNSFLLWAAFARRGLGVNADQGSSNSNSDNVEDFTPIPVELTTFGASIIDGDVLLSWGTLSETNNAGFEVQHHAEGGSFEALGFVEGHGTTTEVNVYRYTVSDLSAGTHTFRLKQIDFDGAYEYSPEIEVAVGVVGTHQLSRAYPNPFNPQAQFTLAVSLAQNVVVELYDVVGRRVSVLHDGNMEANESYRFTVDGSGLASGTYFVRVQGETFTASQRMTLLK